MEFDEMLKLFCDKMIEIQNRQSEEEKLLFVLTSTGRNKCMAIFSKLATNTYLFITTDNLRHSCKA